MRADADRSFWWFLALGLLLRCAALDHPLVDAGLIRQCQTAAVTQSLLTEHGFAISSQIPWAGDFDERFVLEMPIYNYLVIGVAALMGHLTVSGKLVAIALWAFSFWLLQGIWRRALDPSAAWWANLLFIASPLGVFYAQAFMPESLVQMLAFAFLLLLLRHDEQPTLPRWYLAAFTGLLCLLVKAPMTAHLYLVFLGLVVTRERWRSLFRPRYLIAGIVSAACVVGWGNYLDAVNRSPLSFGDTGRNLQAFIGPLRLRFEFQTWKMVALYLGGFMAPGLAALGVFGGAIVVLRRGCSRVLGLWLASIVIFYLLWLGNGPASQGYYNLPALGPVCALFGLGVRAFLEWPRLARLRRFAAPLAAFTIIGCAVPVWIYLFTPDRTILAAANWARDHTEPGAPILFRAAHRADLQDYAPNPVFPFYAGRPTFIWVNSLPEPYRSAALQRTKYAVVTLPQPEGKWLTRLRRLRGLPTPPPESTQWLEDLGFQPIAEDAAFVAFRRQ